MMIVMKIILLMLPNNVLKSDKVIRPSLSMSAALFNKSIRVSICTSFKY